MHHGRLGGARDPPAGHHDGASGVYEKHLAGLVWDEKGEITQDGPTNRDRVEVGRMGEFLKGHQRRVSRLEPLGSAGVDFRCRGQLITSGAFFDEHAACLGEGGGNEDI